MRRTLAALALAAALAIAQAARTAEELVSYIKTAIAQKYKDADVAASLQHMRLSTRLDPGAVTELQRLGAGPKTVAALTKLAEASAGAPAAAPKVETVAPPAPSAAEQKSIIAEMRENSLNYTSGLPNYICRQVTKRHVDPTGNGSFRDVDSIVEQLTFFDQKESYKVVMVNNSMVTNNLQHDQLGGATSSGEFGSILRSIFAPETRTDFNWARWATLRGRTQLVFDFETLTQVYSIRHAESRRAISTRIRGQVFIDRETKMVMRIHMECEGIPADFPIRAVTVDLDYDFADLGGQQFLLPLHSDVRSREANYVSWNEVSYSGYRKFSADTSITFDK
jgi:hypothetical protein